ncbi:hypothetical protein OBPA_11000 [Polaribacter sp. OB-PA-B3]
MLPLLSLASNSGALSPIFSDVIYLKILEYKNIKFFTLKSKKSKGILKNLLLTLHFIHYL